MITKQEAMHLTTLAMIVDTSTARQFNNIIHGVSADGTEHEKAVQDFKDYLDTLTEDEE